MDTLLRNEYTAHYNLPIATVTNIRQDTNETYFEIEDAHGETQIYLNAGQGTAAYDNHNAYQVVVINYDKFVTSLPVPFQNARKRCDLIVYTRDANNYFLLNELKDTNPLNNTTAFTQLSISLQDIMFVPAISNFADGFQDKRCCFFNKRVIAPGTISATTTFNLVNTITVDGFQMSHPAIEAIGFTLWEYSGGKVFVL